MAESSAAGGQSAGQEIVAARTETDLSSVGSVKSCGWQARACTFCAHRLGCADIGRRSRAQWVVCPGWERVLASLCTLKRSARNGCTHFYAFGTMFPSSA